MTKTMKKMIPLVLLGAGCVLVVACATTRPHLPTVDSVDLDRYVGRWFEIASYPAWFQRGCTGTMAEYSLLPDGRLRVLNGCWRDGKWDTAEGTARVVQGSANTKLKVQFQWPFTGNYWIIALDKEYQWVVIGEPSRKYLWILSRSPELAPATYRMLTERVRELGYDPARLQHTVAAPAHATQ